MVQRTAMRDAAMNTEALMSYDEAEQKVEDWEEAKAEAVVRTLGKVVEIASKCLNFFDWDWCQDQCPLYKLCDGALTVQDTTKIPPSEGWAEAIKRWLRS